MGDKDLSRFEEPQLNQAKSNIMARYEVRAERVPEFRPRDVYTRAGLADYSMRLHPGLILGDFFGSNRGEAYEMYLEDERLGNIAGLVDTALAITIGGDKAEGDAILGEVRRAYLRDERSDPLQAFEDAPKTHTGEPVILNLELRAGELADRQVLTGLSAPRAPRAFMKGLLGQPGDQGSSARILWSAVRGWRSVQWANVKSPYGGIRRLEGLRDGSPFGPQPRPSSGRSPHAAIEEDDPPASGVGAADCHG